MKAMDKYTQEEQQLMQILMYDGAECSVYPDLQVWAMKNDRVDKRLIRDLEMAYQDDVSHSPPLPSFMSAERGPEMTAFGPRNDPAARRLFQQCIATLNKCYEHHVFNNAKPSDFVKEDLANVINQLSSALPKNATGLSAPRSYSSYPPTHPEFFPPPVATSSSPADYARPSPFAPPPTISGTDPILYHKLDRIIELRECEVYAYVPDTEADPHYDDDADEEEDADEGGSDTDDDELFAFDEYDVDEHEGDVHAHELASDDSDESPSRTHPARHRGPTLWSSHYFFVSRRQKRILYLSLWAKAKSVSAWRAVRRDVLGFTEAVRGERFHGWDGAAGAGARAMGLTV